MSTVQSINNMAQNSQQAQQNSTTNYFPSAGSLTGGIVGTGSSTTIYHGGQQGQSYLGGGLYSGYTSSTYTEPDIALRKVENGWILKMKGKEYILNGTDKVEKYLKLFLE
jgi:hypothetical protein